MQTLFRLLLPVAAISSVCALPEGFVIRDFAGPPEVDYPTALTAAANGDVYVSSDQNGSLGHDEHMGRIIRCRDKDGDGKADEFIKFVPDVSSPRGGHFVGDTLYLIHPPFLSSYRDTNGDGVADEEKVLVTGLGGGIENPRGADHTTNGVRIGIDGWLYIAVGDFGAWPAKGTDGSTCLLHGGGVLRVRPDGSQVEAFAVMTRNICDIAISPTLDLYSRDNTNDGKGWNTRFHHYTSLGNHGYPRLYQNFADEAIQPLADYGGGSGTGALWLSEPGFPPEFSDALFSCDWTTGNLYYHPWKRSGASFTIEQKTFEKLPHATDIDVDGFSRLYLADWRGGTFNYAGKDKPVGQIQQVIVKGGSPAKYEDVTKANDSRLIELLASPSAVQRLEAQRQILVRGAKPESAKGILAIARDSRKKIAARVAAIFTYKQLYGKESTRELSQLVADASIREYVLRAMTDLRNQLDGVPVKPYLDALTDPDPRVALQGLIGIQRLDAKDAAKNILTAAPGWKEAGISPRLTHTAVAVLASLGKIEPLIAATQDPATRTIALRSLERIPQMDTVDALLKLVAATKEADLRIDALLALARLYHQEKAWDLKSWWGTRPDDRGPYFEPITWEASAKIGTSIEDNFALIPKDRQSAFLTSLAKNRIPVSSLKLAGLDPVLTALASPELDKSGTAVLIDAAKDSKRSFPQRVECYKALNRTGKDLAMPSRLIVLAAWSQEKDIPAESNEHITDFVNETERGNEIAKLRKLAATKDNAMSRIAWKAILTIINSPLAKTNWKEEVLKLVAENPREVGFFLAIADLKLTGFDKQIELGLSFDNEELIAAAKTAKAAVTGASTGGKKVAEIPIAELMATVMKANGDVATGQRLFTAQGCISCHSVDPAAEQKGPYLGSAGAKFPRDYLIESVLDPSKAVAQGFQTIILTMKDGSAQMGFVTGEVDGVIELRNIAGQVAKLKRADVTKEEHLPQSMMPAGLAAGLTVEDFTSLIDYLNSLKAKGG